MTKDQADRSDNARGYAESENSRLQTLLSDIENTRKAAEMTAENAERKYVELSRQFDRLNDEKYQGDHQNHELTNSLRREQDNFAGAQARCQDLTNEKGNLLATIGDLKLQVDRLNANLTDSQASSEYAHNQLRIITEQTNVLEKDLRDTSNRLQAVSSDSEAAHAQNEHLRRELNSIEMTVNSL